MNKWSEERAWEWYSESKFIMGFNYVTSTAVNAISMWQDFDDNIETIDAEITLASKYGFNSVRIFLNYLLWKHDKGVLKKKLSKFFDISEKHNMKVLVVFFDDCNFGHSEPYIGEQLSPIEGVHNSRWSASPGTKIADNQSEWLNLEKYIKDMIESFRDDPRVLAWDLYNEPGNNNRGERTLALLRATFKWAREVNPTQPLTSGAWESNLDSICDRECFALSDIISFHGYWDLKTTKKLIEKLKSFNRPIFCTEWLHRAANNVTEEILPYLYKNKIAAYNWGLVKGKTQTHLSWETIDGKANNEPKIWQHDLFNDDYSPYMEKEMELFKFYGKKKNIFLRPVNMTEEIMIFLEGRNCIKRLAPGKITKKADDGKTIGNEIYKSDVKYGSHMLLEVIVNRDELSEFGYHPDNEEFLLIGNEDVKPLYIVIALCTNEELEEKLRNQNIKDEDFITLKVKYNDPKVSFFTMLKGVPHGEVIANSFDGNPATFYVTEPSDMGIMKTEWHDYSYLILDNE